MYVTEFWWSKDSKGGKAGAMSKGRVIREESSGRDLGSEELQEGISLRRNRSLRLLVWFLGAMVLFALISRTLYSLSLPKVQVSKPVSATIAHKIDLEGTLEPQVLVPVIVDDELPVKSVLVKAGDVVECGQPLLEYDGQMLADRIEDAIAAVSEAEAAIREGQNAVQKSEEQKNIEIARAQEDYDEACKRGAAGIERAYESLAAAEREAQKNPEDQELRTAYEAAEKAYEDAQAEAETLSKNAQRSLEDARSLEVQQLSNGAALERALEKSKKELAHLEEIQSLGGNVLSPVSGTVETLPVTAGSIANGCVATIADECGEYRLQCYASADEAKYVSAGDAASVTFRSSSEGIETQIASVVEMPDDPSIFIVTAVVPSEFASKYSTAKIECVKTSDRYSEVLPISSLISYSESGKERYCVYKVDDRDTILGRETIAQRVEVDVDDENGQYVAVKGGITSSDEIIVEWDREITDGARVREATS